MSATPALRIALADDQALVRAGLRALLERLEVAVVVEADDGASLLDAVGAAPVDVVLSDVRMPGMDGIAMVRALRERGEATPVLLLTALGAVADRVEGLDAGANDYLLKPFDFDELLARLRALRRGYRAEGRRRGVSDWTYLPDTAVVYGPSGERIALTSTENAVLELLTRSPDHVFSREAIARAVFSSPDAVTTVDTYVHYLRRKTATDLVETVRGRGYRAGAER